MLIKTSADQLSKIAACIILMEKYKRLNETEIFIYYMKIFYVLLEKFGMDHNKRLDFMNLLIQSGIVLVDEFRKEMQNLKNNQADHNNNNN